MVWSRTCPNSRRPFTVNPARRWLSRRRRCAGSGERRDRRHCSVRNRNPMPKIFAPCVVLALAAAAAAAARPFTATDLARLERVSDPHVSADGRFVAYNVRSTDWEANRGLNAVWVLERGL